MAMIRDLKMDVVWSTCLTCPGTELSAGTERILQAAMFASHLFENGAAAEKSDYLSLPSLVPTSLLSRCLE